MYIGEFQMTFISIKTWMLKHGLVSLLPLICLLWNLFQGQTYESELLAVTFLMCYLLDQEVYQQN